MYDVIAYVRGSSYAKKLLVVMPANACVRTHVAMVTCDVTERHETGK